MVLEPAPLREQEDQRAVAEKLHSGAIHLLRRLRRLDVAMGLSPARASALSVLVFGGPRTLGQLATIEHVTAPTMTRLVAGMERGGLVRRQRDREDQRSIWIHATPKGTRLLHAGRRRRVDALANDIGALDASDRRTLAAAADVFQRAFR